MILELIIKVFLNYIIEKQLKEILNTNQKMTTKIILDLIVKGNRVLKNLGVIQVKNTKPILEINTITKEKQEI